MSVRIHTKENDSCIQTCIQASIHIFNKLRGIKLSVSNDKSFRDIRSRRKTSLLVSKQER